METDQRKRDQLAKIGARAYECIEEMVDNLRAARETDDHGRIEDAEMAIQEDPLSIQVRSDWQIPGEELKPGEYEILLSWGGPATRIIGELDEYGQPETAELQAQDWFLPWTEYYQADPEVLLEYVRQFYIGAY